MRGRHALPPDKPSLQAYGCPNLHRCTSGPQSPRQAVWMRAMRAHQGLQTGQVGVEQAPAICKIAKRAQRGQQLLAHVRHAQRVRQVAPASGNATDWSSHVGYQAQCMRLLVPAWCSKGLTYVASCKSCEVLLKQMAPVHACTPLHRKAKGTDDLQHAHASHSCRGLGLKPTSLVTAVLSAVSCVRDPRLPPPPHQVPPSQCMCETPSRVVLERLSAWGTSGWFRVSLIPKPKPYG